MLAPWAVEISDRIDLDVLCDRVVAAVIEAAFPDRADSKGFVAGLRGSVTENLAALRSVLDGSLELEHLRLDRPLRLGALLAQLRIPQSAMQRSYRVGFLTMWEAWATAMAEQVPHELRPDLATQLLELTRTVLVYQDHVALQVAERLNAEEQALSKSRAHVRHRLVEAVLRDPDTPLSPADLTTIAYRFDQHHLAVLLPTLAEGAAARLAIGLADVASTRSTLTLPRELDASVVWIGRSAGWSTPSRLAVRDALRSVGLRATIGEPGAGLAGFRASLQTAQEADELRVAAGDECASPVLDHAEVALEVLLLRDPGRAARFVRDELGELAADTAEAARLRATLAESYRLTSHVATAAALHVHEHTVRNRLRKVEELLRHPLTERSTEVQVALRLVRVL